MITCFSSFLRSSCGFFEEEDDDSIFDAVWNDFERSEGALSKIESFLEGFQNFRSFLSRKSRGLRLFPHIFPRFMAKIMHFLGILLIFERFLHTFRRFYLHLQDCWGVFKYVFLGLDFLKTMAFFEEDDEHFLRNMTYFCTFLSCMTRKSHHLSQKIKKNGVYLCLWHYFALKKHFLPC